MFCFKCGEKIANGSAYCSHCGAQIQIASNTASNNTATSQTGELNRTALCMYLTDLRNLESAKEILRAQVYDIDARYNSLGIPQQIIQPVDPDSVGLSHYVFSQGVLSGGLQYKIDKDSYPQRLAEYQRAINIERARLAAEEREKMALAARRNAMYDEWCAVRDLLEKAYSINIVPNQFRNIFAVFYLHDFITTSNESLTTAMLQFKLDEIKEKLTELIIETKKSIVNQALLIAQNDQLAKQNRDAITYLGAIEQNTANAAMYSKIAANNAEACNWLMTAKYISGT